MGAAVADHSAAVDIDVTVVDPVEFDPAVVESYATAAAFVALIVAVAVEIVGAVVDNGGFVA